MVLFPLRRGWPGRLLLAPLAPRRPYAELTGDTVRVRMGALGRADIPIAAVATVGRMNWPWWGGLGVRIGGRGLVAYIARSGPAAVLALEDPLKVRVPLPWTAQRVAIGVEDLDGFLAALAAMRVVVDAGEGGRRAG